jgi:hypothetical protein
MSLRNVNQEHDELMCICQAITEVVAEGSLDKGGWWWCRMPDI